MPNQHLNRSLPPALALVFAATAFAQAPAPTQPRAPQAPGSAQTPTAPAASEQALVRTAQDPQMQWNPCPPFLPAGCGLAVLHGDPSKPNADVFLRLPARSEIPSHWHTSAERMVLVAGELHVTYEGQPKTVLKPGTYAYGPAKRPHSGSCVSSTPCILFIAFESAVDAVPTGAAAK